MRIRFSAACALTGGSRSSVLFTGDPLTCAERARRRGFDAVEFQVRTPEELDLPALSRWCRENRFAVSGLACGRAKKADGLTLIDDDAGVRARAVGRILQFVAAAETLGASVVIGSMRGSIPNLAAREKYAGYFYGGLEEILAFAGPRGVAVCIEVKNRYENNYMNTAGETLEFLRPIDMPNLKVLLDTFHMNIEEPSMARAIELCGEKLGYLHMADNTRGFPGSGSLDFGAVFEALGKICFSGYAVIECRPGTDPDTAAARGLETLRRAEARAEHALNATRE